MPASDLTPTKLAAMVKIAFNAREVDLIRSEVIPATSTGENFVGDVCAVDMTVRFDGETEEKPLHWIVKTRSESPIFPVEVMRQLRSEETETTMYSEVRQDSTKSNI